MSLTVIAFALFLYRLEALLREDYARLSVRKRDMKHLLALALLLKLIALSGADSGDAAFAVALLRALAGACITALPFLLLYRLRASPGMADVKYAWICGLLLPLAQAMGALLLACLWALLKELGGWSRGAWQARRFAFLPYLCLSSLPFICKQLFFGGY